MTVICSAAQSSWANAVIVPAQNESLSIGRCLQSIKNAAHVCNHRASTWIVVVADECTDNTADIARTVLGTHGEVIECAHRSAGTARRIGVEAALHHFQHYDRDRTWLANTDADTCVPDEWLAHQLDLADQGVTAVAGIVGIDALSGLAPELASLLMADYEIAMDGTHKHVHGANLGVRADAYIDAGGWSDLALAEDHCLWGRLKMKGWPVAASASSIVMTSGRLHGRATGGFADTLRAKFAKLSIEAS